MNSILRGDFEVLSFGPRVFRAYLNIFVKLFQKQIAYLDSLQKNTQIQKKIWLNQSLDEGDIVDLKSALFPENFVTRKR